MLRESSAEAVWRTLGKPNGDIAQMEYLSAHYNPRQDSFVAGAQDNAAQVFARNQRATGFVEGDGTVTMIDNVHNPSRMYGTTQFLGVGTIDIDPENSLGQEDDDDDCGLCFNQGDDFIGVPLKKYFPPRHRSRFLSTHLRSIRNFHPSSTFG